MANIVITRSNSQTSQIFDSAAGATLFVANDGYLIESRTGGYPTYYANGGGVRASIAGSVINYGGYGALYLGQSESNTGGGGNQVTIASSGYVEGGNGVSLFGGGNTLVNDGMIRGTGTTSAAGIPNNVSGGVYMRGGGTVNNNGTITGLYGVSTFNGDTTITNSGTISSTDRYAIYSGTGNLTVNNSGTIYGGISSYNTTRSEINNTGLIDGDVFVPGASITNYGTITGGCSGNSGQDFIVNYGTINYVSVLDGADYVYNKAGGVIGSVSFGVATPDLEADRCTNDGQIGYVSFNAGDDTFINTGRVEDSVSLGDGANSLNNSGSIGGQVGGGDGSDTITNFGSINTVFGGAGGDTLINGADGIIELRVILGFTEETADADLLINHGRIGVDLDPYYTGLATIFFGNGADRLENTGTIYGSVDMGTAADIDTVTNSGQITGGVVMGAGDDVVDTTDGRIDGRSDLGDGNDSYAGGAYADRVAGGAGRDTINLGAGDDTYYAGNVDARDSIDGGDGIDTYNASACTAAVTIDLSSGTAGGTVGPDVFDSFERAIGGRANDTLIGSDGDNRLDGGLGNDNVSGGDGADRLIGGGGSDTLTGGAGRDIMTGGTPAGGTEADVFAFTATGDSGTRAATRDVITDFTDHGTGAAPAVGADTIDLSAIDANTALAGNQTFSFNSVNGAAFSGTAGELIWRQTGTFALILGDTNGDKVADFTIQLSGTHVLTAADFVL